MQRLVTDRALAGMVLAGALAIGAHAARSLTRGGAVAAVAIGTAAATAGWDWAAILILFFVTSTALSRFRHAAKQARTADVVEKGDERDALQVLANGGVFAAGALAASATGTAAWALAALGALAAATADTWATEVGTLAGRPPRSVISFEALPPGTSGGVTVPGTAASVLGAGLIAAAAHLMGLTGDLVPVLVGGVAGSMADSLTGATVQERRWCDRCARETERRVHSCGAPTRVTGGVRGIRNDMINLVCTVAGGIVAVMVSG